MVSLAIGLRHGEALALHLADYDANACVAAIEKHLAKRREMREWAGARWRETGFLFCSTIGTSLIERNVLRDLHKVLELAGLPKCRMHDLRHSCVTLLSAQGVLLRTIADIVGHSDIRLTQNILSARFHEHEA